jgi:sulfonate transport system ATP-binding protein
MDIRNVTVSYGQRILYKNFSYSFIDHSITAILGPSGCGKTTLLNAIAFGNNDFRTSYIFQEPRLLPWFTLEKNIELVLEEGSRLERLSRAREYLGKVGLGKRAGEYPAHLSGGERQRVAIARAFSCPAPVLLMDEPFQSQDPAIKAQLIALVQMLQKEEKRTILAVTHDVREASALADRAVILNGSPVEVVLDIPVAADFEKKLSEVLSCQTSVW